MPWLHTNFFSAASLSLAAYTFGDFSSFAILSYIREMMRWYLNCILHDIVFRWLRIGRGTPILSGATLFTSLLVCFVQLPRQELHTPRSSPSELACELPSVPFLFQKPFGPLATEILLVPCFQ